MSTLRLLRVAVPTLALAVGLVTTLTGATVATPTPTPTVTPTPTPTPTATPVPNSFGEGIHQVGAEMPAGRYGTPGAAETCGWARLTSRDSAAGPLEEFDAVTGPSEFTVLATDAFVELTGDCVWTLIAATPTPTPTPTRTPTPTPTPSADDRDCADFATQALAQAALDADRTDPDNLDADDDGTACEDRFGTEGQQVSVLPLGGVATGGRSAS